MIQWVHGEVKIFLANRNFPAKLREFAQTYSKYGLSIDDAAEYVINHEMVHASGVQSEEQVERVLADYFTQRAKETLGKGGNPKKYLRMAKLAQDRVKQGEEMLRGQQQAYQRAA